MYPMPSNFKAPSRPGDEIHVQPSVPVVWSKGNPVHAAGSADRSRCEGSAVPGGSGQMAGVRPLGGGNQAAGKAGGLSGCSARVGYEEKSMKELTTDRLRELMSYDPDVGVFIRRICSGGCLPGSIAGTPDKKAIC